MKAEISLLAMTHAFPEDVLKAERRESAAIRNSLKLTSELKTELNFITFRIDRKKANAILGTLIEILEGAHIAEQVLEAGAPDSKKKRGPRPYPRRLSQWIVDTIELAKSDAKKLSVLIEFFRPKGEFDKWLGKTSKGVWQGPSKKKTKGIADSFESDLKWLNDFKKSQKKRLKCTNRME